MQTYRRRLATARAIGLGLCAALLGTHGAAQTPDYVLGPQDVLTITLREQPDLSGRYVLQNDGTVAFPLVGRIEASGRTVAAVQEDLQSRLADGYFLDPHVTVSVEEYRSQQVFVVGEVGTPGPQPLTGDTTLLQALTAAGPLGPNAGSEIVIVRPREDREAQGAVLPGEPGGSELLRIDLERLQTGQLVQRIALRDGDTIFVPKAEQVYVFGQVKSPGAYPVRRGTTVLQALSLAGGLTDRGSTNRIRIVRMIDGEEHEIRAQLHDLLHPNDVIMVPERWF